MQEQPPDHANESPAARVETAFRRAECEHVAALLKSAEELPPVLAGFLSLGAARNGWLVHGSLPGQAGADARRLVEAGLDVSGLMANGQLEIMALDLTVTPQEWVVPWSAMLDERLAAGFDALWFTRFPVQGDDDDIVAILPFEEAWMECFRGRRVVTLCPYIVTGLSPEARAARRDDIGRAHDRIIDLGGMAA